MKRRFVFGMVLVTATAAVVFCAGRPARRQSEEWDRVKADVKAWTADNDAYTERLKRGEPHDEKYAAELVDRMRQLNIRYEKVRKW